MTKASKVKLDLLTFGAHPDDVEIGMGGTLALHANNGFNVGIVDLTRAELSSNGTVSRRVKEAAEAALVLGLAYRDNLGFADRGLMNDRKAVVNAIVDVIRSTQPRFVFAPYERDRHPDHGHCGSLVEEAVFSAGVEKYTGDLGYPRHRVQDLFFYFINGFHQPDIVMDITSVQKQKMTALSSYRSQFISDEAEVETPLTNGYLETVESRDRLFGKEVAVMYAEGFISKKPFKLESFL